MSDTVFNVSSGEVVERRLLVLYLNTGTSSAPVWSPVGQGVEDSASEYDWGEESKTDIFGITRVRAKRPIINQTFEPWELTGGDVAQQHIWNLAVKEQDAAKIANQDVLVVHTYTGTPAFAERWPSSMVKVSSLGGSSTVAMPIDVTYGGDRVVGTATVTGGVPTFTAEH